MDYNIPHRISEERDLAVYESYLKNERNNSGEISAKADCAKKTVLKLEGSGGEYLRSYLKKQIGKLVKIEALVGERLEVRTGILWEIGEDFIEIKLNRNCCTTVIDLSAVRFITVIHNNDRRLLYGK